MHGSKPFGRESICLNPGHRIYSFLFTTCTFPAICLDVLVLPALFYPVLDDQVLGMVNLFLTQPPTAAVRGKLWVEQFAGTATLGLWETKRARPSSAPAYLGRSLERKEEWSRQSLSHICACNYK